MKKLLIFNPNMESYRIDLYNRLSKDFGLDVVLSKCKKKLIALGFELYKIKERPVFNYKYYQNTLNLGRLLLSMVSFCKIRQSKNDPQTLAIIGNNVVIYTGAQIIALINIGDNAIIGANAVVIKIVPENAVMAGIPAKILIYQGEEYSQLY